LEARSGQTFGKRFLGLRVVRTNGERVGFWRAVARRIPFYTQVPVLYAIDGAFAFFTTQRQRAFDRVAETQVIRTPARHTPLAWLTIVCSLLLIVGFGQQWQHITDPPDGPRFPPIFDKGRRGASCASHVVTPNGRDTLALLGSFQITLKDYRLIWARPFMSGSTTFDRGLYVLSTVDQEHTARIRLDCRSYTPIPGQSWQMQQVP
jgi:hypothetical protein